MLAEGPRVVQRLVRLGGYFRRASSLVLLYQEYDFAAPTARDILTSSGGSRDVAPPSLLKSARQSFAQRLRSPYRLPGMGSARPRENRRSRVAQRLRFRPDHR